MQTPKESLAKTSSSSQDVVPDLNRKERCGFPEVVFGEGKTLTQLHAATSQLLEAEQPTLITRVDETTANHLVNQLNERVVPRFNETARTLTLYPDATVFDSQKRNLAGYVPVLGAGSTDAPVVEEAIETLNWMQVTTKRIVDVGVAGPHRLIERVHLLSGADAIVVAAGMEGALPSVVAGHVDCPVIAVPTSVGYGANLGGVAALLSMLNSCAANVTVVNIDAGFKAGFVAGLIARGKPASQTLE